MSKGLQPLSESLGLPDVWPHLPDCEEDRLTPEALTGGYRYSEAAAVGITPHRELQLTLTDQPPGFYSAASLAYWRTSLRQQLQGPARLLSAKRKAHELFDVPLSSSSTTAAAGAAAAAPAAATAAAAAAPGHNVSALPPPRFPQQSSRGASGREAAEAWAQQQLAAPGAPQLRALGWGGPGGSEAALVPHGFPRNRLFELLAELAPPLPRALWSLRVLSLNRTRPSGWDGASEAQQRSRQFTEELLSFLESAATPAPAPLAPAPSTGRPPLPGSGQQARKGQQQAQQGAAGSEDSAATGMPEQWQYGLRLAGHCCAAGMLDAGKAAEWAASSQVLLPLPAAGRRQVLALLGQCLRAAPLAQQQALVLAEQCLKAAEAAAGSAATAAGKHASGGQLQQQAAECKELQQGLLHAASQLLELHPAAFVAAEVALLQALLPAGSDSGQGRHVQQCSEQVASARQRLSRALHARVLHWHDAKAMQLLDEQLQGGSSAAEAAAALRSLVNQHPEVAAAAAGPLGDVVRLVCDWAVAAPAVDFGSALAAAAASLAGGQQPEQQLELAGAAALVPERVLFAVAILQTLHTQQQQQQQQQDGALGWPPLQAAIYCWLDGCASEQQQPVGRQHRLLHLALLLAEAGLLCPAAYLRTCLAAAAFPAAASASSSSSGGGGTQPGLHHLALLEQLHPLLDYPTLNSAVASAPAGNKPGGGSGGQAWSPSRQQFASARAAVLARHGLPAVGAASSHSHCTAAAAAVEQAEWEQLWAAAANGSCGSGSDSGPSSSQQERQHFAVLQEQWQDPRLQLLQQQALELLGLAVAPAADDNGSCAAVPGLGELVQCVQQLPPWQQRHTAQALLAAAKAFLASTDSGSGGSRQSATPPPGAPAAYGACRPGWLLQALALLRGCCGHRETLSLLATCLNLLQRAVAAAVRAATTGSQQQVQQLGEVLAAAQQRWSQRSGVTVQKLLALLSAHAGSLAASDISAKLLPMLTGGLWRLQQAQQQQHARECLAGQQALAAELLAQPGGSDVQHWVDRMQQQHGTGHWVVAELVKMRQAAASRASGAPSGSQLLQQATARLQAFLQRAQQLPVLAAAGEGDERQRSTSLLLRADAAPAANGTDGCALAAGLAAVQHSLEPAALPAVLQQLSGALQPGLAQQLLRLGPEAAAALLSNPQQAYACLHHHPHHTAAGGSGGTVAAAWQVALALFGASSSCGTDGSSGLLHLSSSDAMAAAVAAATPATARCCWLLLRLLLDEQQWQGGHRLAEAERQLAVRAAHQAVLRPHAAAALAATLCSLSPSAAAGQQLLQEVEALLRSPVVDLTQQAAQGAARPPLYHTTSGMPAPPPAVAEVPAVAAHSLAPFAAEQGLVDAALVCLSTGSSGDRQHAFAQQLIKQLGALGDALLQHQQPHSSQPGLGGSLGFGHGLPATATAAAAAASPAAVQVSVWVRLALLLPLLPLVYKHRAADASNSLRGQLLRALLRLLAAPAVRADAARARAAAAAGVGHVEAAAAAAAEMAGEPLPQRLLHLLRALLVGGWASWMRLEGGKLRDVPAFEHSHKLATEAAALPLPPNLQAAVQAAMPLGQQQGLAEVPVCHETAAAGSSDDVQPSGCSSTLSLDPWLLLEGGTDGGAEGLAAAGPVPGIPGAVLVAPPPATAAAAAGVPPWLGGAVKRRRRELCYTSAPHTAAAPMLTVEEQLRRQQQQAAAATAAAEARGLSPGEARRTAQEVAAARPSFY